MLASAFLIARSDGITVQVNLRSRKQLGRHEKGLLEQGVREHRVSARLKHDHGGAQLPKIGRAELLRERTGRKPFLNERASRSHRRQHSDPFYVAKYA